mmetsp:Transcript_833/g.1884  ORF Transcript_833/g.1884 Transcript_833/m.1884 type:complete len:208 (-) Transcript_833:117-740(-)
MSKSPPFMPPTIRPTNKTTGSKGSMPYNRLMAPGSSNMPSKRAHWMPFGMTQTFESGSEYNPRTSSASRPDTAMTLSATKEASPSMAATRPSPQPSPPLLPGSVEWNVNRHFVPWVFLHCTMAFVAIQSWACATSKFPTMEAVSPKDHAMALHMFSMLSTKSSDGTLCTRWYCTPKISSCKAWPSASLVKTCTSCPRRWRAAANSVT